MAAHTVKYASIKSKIRSCKVKVLFSMKITASFQTVSFLTICLLTFNLIELPAVPELLFEKDERILKEKVVGQLQTKKKIEEMDLKEQQTDLLKNE